MSMFRIFTGLTASTTGLPSAAADHMNIYMNKLDEFHDYVTDWFKYRGDALAVSAEMFTSGQLRNHGIPVQAISVPVQPGQRQQNQKRHSRRSVSRETFHAKPFHIPFRRT